MKVLLSVILVLLPLLAPNAALAQTITISAGDTSVTVGAYGDAPFIATLDEASTADYLALRTSNIVLTCSCNETDGYFKPNTGEESSIEIVFAPGKRQDSFWFIPTPMLEEDFSSVEFTCSAELASAVPTAVTVNGDRHDITVTTRQLQVVYKRPSTSNLRYGHQSGDIIVATETALSMPHPLTVVVHRSEGTIQFPGEGRLADTLSLALGDTAGTSKAYQIIAGASSGPIYDRNASFNALSLSYVLSSNYDWYDTPAASPGFSVSGRPTQRGVSATAEHRFLIEGRLSEPIYVFLPEPADGDLVLTAYIADQSTSVTVNPNTPLANVRMTVGGTFGEFDLLMRPDSSTVADQYDSGMTSTSTFKVHQRKATIAYGGTDYRVGETFTVTVNFQYGPNAELSVQALMPGCDVSPATVTLAPEDAVAAFSVSCDQTGTFSFDYILTGGEAHLFTHPAKVDFSITARSVVVQTPGTQAVLFPSEPLVIALSHPAENGLTVTPHAQGVTFDPATVEFAAGQRLASFMLLPKVMHPEDMDFEIDFLLGGGDRPWYSTPGSLTVTVQQPGLSIYSDGYYPFEVPSKPDQITHYVGREHHYMLSAYVPLEHTVTVTLVASPAGAVNITAMSHELTVKKAYSDFYLTLLSPVDFVLHAVVTYGIKSTGYTYRYEETFSCTGSLRPIQIWRHCGPKETTDTTDPTNRRCVADKTHPQTNWNRLNDLKLNTYFNFTLYSDALITEPDNEYRGLAPDDELVVTPYSEHIIFDPPKFTFVKGVSNVLAKIKGQVAGVHSVRFINSGKNALWYKALPDQTFEVPVSGGLPLDFESPASVVAPALSLLLAAIAALLLVLN